MKQIFLRGLALDVKSWSRYERARLQLESCHQEKDALLLLPY